MTPGFVDIHTHFDGQATWDPILAPSSLHGVTSVAMGNCGVGFAPAKPTPEQHDWLIGMLEGVEDIPGTALAEGLPWDWESFPEYLDALDRRQYTVDIGTHVVHAPLRAYVMGERGADPNEAPTADELLRMADAVRDGVRAGALGFTTSRTVAHRTRDGAPLGTRYSTEDELTALVGAMAETGMGVVQMISDAYLSEDETFARDEMALMRTLVEHSGRPLSMTTQQVVEVPDRWREMVGWVAKGVSDGLNMRNQVAPRPVGVLQGLTASVNPITLCPSFREIADRPLAEKVAALRDPERRARIVAEHPEVTGRLEGMGHTIFAGFDKLFPMDEPVNYEPSASSSVAARAAARGVDPVEETIDLLLGDDGNQLLILTLFNFVHGNLDDVREMLLSPYSVIGLGDAGAHCGAISDASFPTTALALWTKRTAGSGSLPIELMVNHLTQRTAQQVGWFDRGVVAPGLPRRPQRHRRRPPRRQPPAHHPRPACRWSPADAVGRRLRPHDQARHGHVQRRHPHRCAARRPRPRRPARTRVTRRTTWASSTAGSPSSPAPAGGSAGSTPCCSPARGPRWSSTTSAAAPTAPAPTPRRPSRSSTRSRRPAARPSPATTTSPTPTRPRR